MVLIIMKTLFLNEIVIWASRERQLLLTAQPLQQVGQILGISSIVTKLDTKTEPNQMYCSSDSAVLLHFPHKMFLMAKFIDFLKSCDAISKVNMSSPVDLLIEKIRDIQDLFSIIVCGGEQSMESQLTGNHQRIWRNQLTVYIDTSATCQKGIYFYNKLTGEISEFEGEMDLGKFHDFVIEKASKGFVILENLNEKQLLQIFKSNLLITFLYSKSTLGYLNVKSLLHPERLNILTSNVEILETIIGKDEYPNDISIVIVEITNPIRFVRKFKLESAVTQQSNSKFRDSYTRRELKPYIYKKTKFINDLEFSFLMAENLRKGSKPFLVYFYTSCGGNCEEIVKFLKQVKGNCFKSRFKVGIFDIGSHFTHHFADLGQGLFIFWRTQIQKRLRFKQLSLKITIPELKRELRKVTKSPVWKFFQDEYTAYDLEKYF